MSSKARGKMIHGHSAGYFGDSSGKAGKTEEELLYIGFTQKAIDTVIKPNLAELGRKLKDKPDPLALGGKFGVPVYNEKTERNEAATVDSLPAGKVGSQYVVLLTGAGGYKPYHFEAVEIPLGLELTLTGVLKGVPLQEGANKLTVKIIDSLERSATGGLILQVAPQKMAEEIAAEGAPVEIEPESPESETLNFAPLLEVATHEFDNAAVAMAIPQPAPVTKTSNQTNGEGQGTTESKTGTDGENKADADTALLSEGKTGNQPEQAAPLEGALTGKETPASGIVSDTQPVETVKTVDKGNGSKKTDRK